MDTMKQMRSLVLKYRYVLAVVAAGLVLMLLPQKEEKQTEMPIFPIVQHESLADCLEEILGKIQGVGKVQVMLTESQGSKTIYVFDESESSDSFRSDAVIVTDASRAQNGLISQVIPPVYQGAIVVCQGGDSPAVKLAVVEAVCDATGLSADRITVLKMK